MMKMYEKLNVGIQSGFPTEREMEYAMKVHGRFVSYLKELYGMNYGSDRQHTAPSFAAFLLEDVGYRNLDSFTWDIGQLVYIRGKKEIGITTGWGFSPVANKFSIVVKSASGSKQYRADELSVAKIPSEILEYVKSTLQGKVHDKVDEAFRGDVSGEVNEEKDKGLRA